jgi:hypothetical protein
MHPSLILFALGFSQLFMLGWLAAAAVPILIHLWNKRKHREVTWAAIEYLLAAIQKHSRRLRIEQWLLLAVRTAIIAVVVLAVAGPYLERSATPFIAGRPTHKLFIIDGSYSMAYRSTDNSRFDRARELAAEIVAQSAQGDAFTLILMASPPRVIVGTPSQSPRDFLLEIENLKLHHTGADLAATLAQADAVLKSAARDQSRLAQHEVFFFTDLGRTTWDAAVTPTGEARAHLGRLADDATLWLVDLGMPQTENFALADLGANDAYLTTAAELTFEAVVKSFSAEPQRRKVEFVVDGQRIGEQLAEAPPHGEASVTFRHRFDAPGEHAVEARLAGDSLPVDDRRWLSAPVKSSIETLIVNGEANPRAANYLRFALDPDSGRSQNTVARSPIRATVVAETALLEMELGRFDCIFLSNVEQFTRGEAQVLGSYVETGGGLVFFLGNRVLADRYNEELGSPASANRLLPVVLEQPVTSSQYSFDPLSYRHPIVAPFRGNEGAGLLQTFVTKYFRMRLTDPQHSKAQVAMAFAETGDPAIVTQSVHRGQVTVVALPASLESVDAATKVPWTLMTATQSFQPIVQEILARTLRGKNRDRNTGVGEPIGAAAPLIATNTSIALHTPDGRQEQVRVSTGASDDEQSSPGAGPEESQWSFGDTWWSGIYTAEAKGTGDASQLFAVNVDTAESDLTRVALDELPDGITPLGDGEDPDQPTAGALGVRGGLDRAFLYIAVGLLLIEMVLAFYFGYRVS